MLIIVAEYTTAMLKNLVLKNRSYRKFKKSNKVSRELLMELIDLARFAPSSKNRQPLKYILLTDREETDFVFKQLKWAWFVRDWDGPAPNERPPAYIIMLLDKQLNERADFDAGIAAQTMLLGAVEKGLGGCIIRTVNRYEVAKYYQLPEHLEVILVLALGEPKQTVKLETEDKAGNMAYWMDEAGTHHVPKRKLDDLIYK